MQDTDLLRDLKQGHANALENIIREYHPYVAKIICTILHEYLHEVDVQRMINHVFFRLWKSRERIDSSRPEAIKHYLGAIARNAAIDEKRKVISHLPMEEHILGTVNESYSQIELREVLISAIKQLDKQSQVIFLKFYFQGKPISKIAIEHGITESSVKTILSRGRKKLKTLLSEGGVIYEN